MSDLIARLRRWEERTYGPFGKQVRVSDETALEAAARIQALEAERIGLLQANLEANTQLARVTLKKRNLETSLAEAEGRVIAEVVAWLRHPDRRKLIEVEPAKPGYWTNDDEPEWVFSRSALKRLPTHKDFATALETGEWKK